MRIHGTTAPASLFNAHPGSAFAMLRRLPDRLVATARLWAERDRERRELARMDRGVRGELQARGLDPEFEARKPFWKE